MLWSRLRRRPVVHHTAGPSWHLLLPARIAAHLNLLAGTAICKKGLFM